MKVRFNKAMQATVMAAAMVAATGASAQSAGQWTAKVGINKITPKVESGDISAPALPSSKGDVGSSTKPILVFAYGITNNISAELDLGMPYKHTIYGAGAISGVGKIGTVEAMPPTVFVQYRFFDPPAPIRPYVGAGATFAYFQKATGSGQLTALTNPGGTSTTFKIDNKLAGSLQAGVVWNVNAKWFVDAGVVKTFLKTKVNFSTGQTQDMKLDPLAVNGSIGYKF
jgi:outer membrane protein